MHIQKIRFRKKMMKMEKYRVLLVDDEQIERMALARKIEKYYGDQVVIEQASDGREAVTAFAKEGYDVIIMDISMPEMNGVMAARQIREHSMDCSIIFLSAYDDFNYTRNAIKVRALDYLLKPCELTDLLAVMDMALHLAEECRKKQEHNQVEEHRKTGIPETEYEDMEYQQEDVVSSKDSELFAPAQRMKNFVTEHYMEEISMQEAARSMGYSDAYFSKLFKQYYNQNFTAYLTEYRIKEAKKLLETTDISIKEISRMVGYSDSNYFAKICKRIEGVIPSRYREER